MPPVGAVVLVGLAAVFMAVRIAAGDRAGTGGELIVYWSESPYPAIWKIRPDGSQRARILRNEQNAKRPALSPDRKWVAFDGAPPGKAPLTDFDIQVVRLDGSGLRTLTRSSQWDLEAEWSPDGSKIVYASGFPGDLFVMDADGTHKRRLTASAADPSWR